MPNDLQAELNTDSEAVLMDSSPLPSDSIVENILNINWKELSRFLFMAVQLGFLLIITQEFQLVSFNFNRYIMAFAFFGFLIHYFLPLSYRLPFFLMLSIVAFTKVLGIHDLSWLFLVGAVFIGICHLPIKIYWRVLILFFSATVLAFMRVDLLASPFSHAVWPILGSMFMFRLIIYLYDVYVNKEKFNFFRSFSYFFLLPNVVFPLFPVVDFQTFRRTYYNRDRLEIYQKGLLWIYRGIIHLILFRFVNQYLTLSPEDIHHAGHLLQYMVANFLLYLRVSGQFHLSIGLLHMFGFNLPETHHLYYLASSFTDFWRRINIYWKDFMQKIFFIPTYFRIRKYGNTKALVLATLTVFFVTWLTHSYQWFWLKGNILFSDSDMLFWAILAIFVLINSLYENKYGRKRSLGKMKRTVGEKFVLAIKTVLVFTTICILWSLWTAPTFSDWLSIWQLAGIPIF